MINRENKNGIEIVQFAHGKASALDVEFLQAITATMTDVAHSNATACVLTGTCKIFSAGVDLKRLVDGGTRYVAEFMPALHDAFYSLFRFPKPMVAACNGHAIAGGCVMLQCADIRLAVDAKSFIGVPEMVVGVPFPLMALEIMRFAVPSHHVQEVLYLGKNYNVVQAKEVGLIDEIVSAESLQSRALSLAQQLGNYPDGVFASNKKTLRRPSLEWVDRHAEEDRAEMAELWSSEAVLTAVREYVAKTLGGS